MNVQENNSDSLSPDISPDIEAAGLLQVQDECDFPVPRAGRSDTRYRSLYTIYPYSRFMHIV